MRNRFGAVAAAAITSAVLNFVGVFYFFQPISAADSAGDPILPAAVGFMIFIVLSVLLLDWVSQQIGHPVKAGVVIALSQIILVSIDFVLRGERGLATGMASAVLILITWIAMGSVYGLVLRNRKFEAPHAGHGV